MRRIGTLDLLGDAAREALVERVAEFLQQRYTRSMKFQWPRLRDASKKKWRDDARATLILVEAHGRDQAHRDSPAEQRPATEKEKHGAQEALRTIEHVGNPQGRTKAVAPEGEGQA